MHYNAVKTFCATVAKDREELGDKVTQWIRSHNGIEIVDTQIRQSSDEAFHCLSITIFYRERS